MNTEKNFLIKYGLHNFVSCARSRGRAIFSIRRLEGEKMTGHATDLIRGWFGELATIQLV